MSTADEINKLKKLLDEGTITEEEFNTGKQNILKSEGSKNTKSSKTKKNLISILVFALLVGSAVLIYINLNTTPTVNTDEPIETTTTVTIDKSKAVPKTTTTTTTTTVPIDLLGRCYNNMTDNTRKWSELGNGSLFLDGRGSSGQGMYVNVLFVILDCLQVPNIIQTQMENTNALMGVVEDEYKNYKISWSYSKSNGLDVYIKEK